jgi:A/G-specific adenine glycosylase
MSHLEKEITSWFKKNKRDLPWRSTTAWGILVSEIMLQQTPVARVEPIWHIWMKRWPSPKDLAKASPADVIKEWGRLGYPRRALRLRECAQVIATDFNNKVPDNEIQLRKLPGVGDYTAAAVMAFAFKERSLVLDINIRRLFSRIYDGVQSPTTAPNKTERAARAELVPKKNAHIWAAATMELGALVCTAQKPKCEICPVSDSCKWRSLN